MSYESRATAQQGRAGRLREVSTRSGQRRRRHVLVQPVACVTNSPPRSSSSLTVDGRAHERTDWTWGGPTMLRSDGALGSTSARLAADTAAAAARGHPRRASTDRPRTDSTGSITGVVVVRDGGVPLPYSVVAVPSLSRERFSDERRRIHPRRFAGGSARRARAAHRLLAGGGDR